MTTRQELFPEPLGEERSALVQRAVRGEIRRYVTDRENPYPRGMEHLVGVVQELSLARDLETVTCIVRRAARKLTGADGATFVLRDGDLCHYVDEDAISPLWKGRRFPMESCISGWSMLHKETVVIEDIYADARLPADAYRPTFVKSLVMVPIRTMAPVGAIGTYWARHRKAAPEEVKLLCALADSTSIAMANVELYQTLEARVQERTAELSASQAALAAEHEALVRVQRQKEELTAFVVHDLKSPASGILMACKLRGANLSDADQCLWKSIQSGAEVIHRMALNLLDIAQDDDGCFSPKRGEVDVALLLGAVLDTMAPLAEERGQKLSLSVHPDMIRLCADEELLRRVLQNLIDNALRHSPTGATVQLLSALGGDGSIELRVIDEGPGIPEPMRDKLFDRYVRLEDSDTDRAGAGHGLGLAFCRLAVQAHGGRIWVEGREGGGSVFVVRLPR